MKFHFFEIIIRARNQADSESELLATQKECQEWAKKGWQELARSSVMVGEGFWGFADIVSIVGTLWNAAKEDFERKIGAYLK